MKKLNTLNEIVLKPFDLSLLYIAGYAEASFANNYDLSLQLGSVIILKEKLTSHDYSIWFVKCHCVTRSVLGEEIYGFSHTMNFVLALFNDLSSIAK